MYKDDLFIPVEIRALMINEAVSAGLRTARDVLDSVNRYCLYEVIIEYWHGNELSVKLIYADNPAKALMHHYNTESRLSRVSLSLLII
jgi:hypothetical protein